MKKYIIPVTTVYTMPVAYTTISGSPATTNLMIDVFIDDAGDEDGIDATQSFAPRRAFDDAGW